MFNVVLLCAGGASTGILAQKMNAVAKEVGLKCNVSAHSVTEAAVKGKDAHVVMLGPQVGFRQEEVQKTLPGVVVVTIEMHDYGNMNAKKILSDAVKAYKKEHKA